MDLRSVLAMAQRQQSVPGLLQMLRGGDPQGVGGGRGVPQSVSSTMAASNAMGDGGGGGVPVEGYSNRYKMPNGSFYEPYYVGWQQSPDAPKGPVTANPDGSRIGVPVEGTDRYKLPDGSFSEPHTNTGAAGWYSELHRPISDPITSGSFRPAPQFGPGYWWSTTGELGIPGQGQYASLWGAGGP